MVGGVFAKACLDFGGIACAFEIDARKPERATQEMDVAIGKAG